MSRKQKIYLITALIFLVYAAVVIGLGFLLGFSGSRLAIFLGVLLLIGLAGAIAAAVFKVKSIGDAPDLASVDTGNLDALMRAAETQLKQGKGKQSLSAMPLVYLLGDENAGKTQTLMQSGLDADLLAGEVYRDGLVAPTKMVNVWYTRASAVVEAGGALLQQPGLWHRLITLTAPGKLRGALSSKAIQPTRAAVVCISLERIFAAPSPDSVRALGKTINEQVRTLSKVLGINLPVYVLFTKLDAIPSFADYVATLTNDEIRDPLGTMLASANTGAGLYSESAATQIGQRLDEITYSLAEFRLEVLARGGDPARLAKAYEFPRDLRKLRTSLVDLLVEAGRPSQLGVNPFLRGFYFIGMRARVVEDAAGTPFATAPAPTPSGDGATRAFSLHPGSSAPTPAMPQPQGRTRRVPQWVFLPNLFGQVFFADRGALETSRASTRVNTVKRILIGSAAACLLLYLVALTVSYFNNRALQSRLETAAAVPVVSHAEPASLQELESLEQLRAVFTQVDGYRKNGAPLSYRWGLYPGDRLYRKACAAYGSHFRTVLLQPTQSLILARLAALPSAPKPTDDYGATYRPFRAYLITTSNPEKSTQDIEPAALQEAWLGDSATRSIPSQSADLALSQFQTYSANLAEPESCLAHIGGTAQAPTVNQTRAFLNQFQGIEQIYLSMKAAADRKNASLRFNDVFPGTKPYVVDSYEVEGAFTKGGYAFMQAAILHPEPYTSGEPWVLGPQTSGVQIDRAALNTQLPARYHADFLATWRAYLKAAHVVPAESFAGAKEKLHQLDSPSSALLELFQLISQNTAVGNPAYSQPFQAPQFVVPPSAPTLPVGIPYITSLQTLEGAINSMLLIPNSQNDPNAVAPVIQAASASEGAVSALRGGFTPPDPVGQVDSTTEALLLAPIKSIEALAKAAPGKAAGGGAAVFCATIAPVLNKFPFNPDSKVEASLPEIAAVFGPGQAIAQYAQQSKMVVLNGSLYMPIPGAPLVPSPAFLHFLNTAQMVTNAFFPAGGGQPTLTFSLTEESVPNLPPATLDIDGSSLTTAGVPRSFTWVSSPSSSVRLTAAAGNSIPASGIWSIFHFAYNAKHPAPGKLEEIFEVNGHPMTSSAGVPLDYKFDVSGPGAPFLNPSFLRSQLRCVTKVAQ